MKQYLRAPFEEAARAVHRGERNPGVRVMRVPGWPEFKAVDVRVVLHPEVRKAYYVDKTMTRDEAFGPYYE